MIRHHWACITPIMSIINAASSSVSPSFHRDLIDDEADIAVAPLSVTKGRAEVKNRVNLRSGIG